MSSHKSGSSSSSRKSKSSRSSKPLSRSTQTLIDALTSHRINTLTELCRAERTAASLTSSDDALAVQAPMTAAWVYYVTSSNQLLAELRGLTRSYPIAAEIVADAYGRVTMDPESNRSWNLAWLCLVKMRDDGLVGLYADVEAGREEMWGGRIPTEEERGMLSVCFEREWMRAIEIMLRHWREPPTWY